MRLRWTKLAEQDLGHIAAYIGQDSPAAAARVVLELIDQTERALTRHAAIGRPGRVIGTRELVISGLPYVIPYRVRDNDIEILRVLHTSRRWPEDL
ncbi:MAG: type II toxin-antitoxin system RelE/ParE family toxin [Betaproteobacteria bacterium]|nr:type II toxin-antitoxin system RelE/ParE family toxin [Betaproteobacteria bacterium]